MTDHTRAPYFPPNLEEYAPWVAKHGLFEPYGDCQCGCGNRVTVSDVTRRNKGYKEGHPVRFKPGHIRQHSLIDRFWERVSRFGPNDCWLWKGKPCHVRGYGRIAIERHTYLAHRLSYEIHFGPISDELFVCHRCDNKMCVNPAHLFLGTPADNSKDMVSKKRQAKGNRMPQSILTPSIIAEIRRLYIPRKVSQRLLGEKYGVSREAISAVINGTNWSHVE